MCPYDERRLPGPVVDDVRRTHPHVRARGERRVSEQYVPPELPLRSFDVALELPVTEPAIDMDGVVALGAARRAFTRIAAATGIAPERVGDLTVAVNEVLTNAMLHCGGAARRGCASGRTAPAGSPASSTTTVRAATTGSSASARPAPAGSAGTGCGSRAGCSSAARSRARRAVACACSSTVR
ncbi:MAG: hypothetical protein KatS3mg010_0715 [Acidimicrobiia bacterium]|nr:MAG: hypothetical protein KatS3mg010_0715 [Acidimicrobiia bacterium]